LPQPFFLTLFSSDDELGGYGGRALKLHQQPVSLVRDFWLLAHLKR